MCGRYTITKKPEAIHEVIPFEGDDAQLTPRFNIAPTQNAPVVIAPGHLTVMRWGLVPFWSKDSSAGYKMINARSETLHLKPSFKKLLQRRRCLVLADGFFEWKKAGKGRQPYYFRLQSREPFAFAGLWDRWHSPEGSELETFTIITTSANDLVRPIHDRMPVILSRPTRTAWLEETQEAPENWLPLLQPLPAELMETFPVSPSVNSPRHDGPDCIVPWPRQDDLWGHAEI